MLDRGLDIPELPAVGKTVRRHVDDSHPQRPSLVSQRLAAQLPAVSHGRNIEEFAGRRHSGQLIRRSMTMKSGLPGHFHLGNDLLRHFPDQFLLCRRQ